MIWIVVDRGCVVVIVVDVGVVDDVVVIGMMMHISMNVVILGMTQRYRYRFVRG